MQALNENLVDNEYHWLIACSMYNVIHEIWWHIRWAWYCKCHTHMSTENDVYIWPRIILTESFYCRALIPLLTKESHPRCYVGLVPYGKFGLLMDDKTFICSSLFYSMIYSQRNYVGCHSHCISFLMMNTILACMQIIA